MYHINLVVQTTTCVRVTCSDTNQYSSSSSYCINSKRASILDTDLYDGFFVTATIVYVMDDVDRFDYDDNIYVYRFCLRHWSK